ncbi:MAG: bifunctional UDP-N-acetylglucosamine diphosphorylase/glucosamine-1-phosphate N-acetyltransferase GlmU, partial [Legionellales bacterium]|nr:bifunctional UDP-N-acetylglucosamine diphosphorylase/glucosamine-1-phosphate N-acetyltransferase GlmU [Legionellales bacterium]
MPNEKPLAVVVLAAGAGKRLKSSLAKTCHNLAGEALIHHVLKTVQKLSPNSMSVVVGHRKEQVIQKCKDFPVSIVEQEELLGTAHAANVAIENLSVDSKVLILFGDVPLIRHSTLENFLQKCVNCNLGVILSKMEDPTGYGRVIRDDSNNINSIVEQKDATNEQVKIKEVFTGILCIDSDKFKEWYPNLNNNNAQQEYYLPDLLAIAAEHGESIASFTLPNEFEIEGVNTRLQLATLEKQFRINKALTFMEEGVCFIDYENVYFRGEVKIGKDCIIDFNVLIENSIINENVTIGANCIIKNSTIEVGAVIEPNTYIDGAVIGKASILGPFARVRPGTKLHSNVKIGNFVEIKNSEVNPNSKINHLSYIGDTLIMNDVNVGAGTVTCNYDGANKHKTTIGKNAFIGSGTQLVAPVTIGKN